MIRNTFEFYQHHEWGFLFSFFDDDDLLMKEFHLAYSAPMNSDDTAESIAERLRNHPPADFICDFDRVAGILMMDRDGEKEIVLFENGEVFTRTEEILEELEDAKLTILDDLPGLWCPSNLLVAGDEYVEVLQSADDADYRIRFLTDSKHKVICRMSNDPFDKELAHIFKEYALAHEVSERELTHISVGSGNTFVSPAGGLWQYTGVIQTRYGVAFIMKSAIQKDYYVLMDKNCNLLAELDEIGIKKGMWLQIENAILGVKYQKTDEDDELDEWYDDDYTLTKRRTSLWLCLWRWFCGLFRRKKSVGGSTGK